MPDDDFNGGAAVPTGRAARLLRFGGIASGIAGGMAAGGCARWPAADGPIWRNSS
jgi:hypothetical protein